MHICSMGEKVFHKMHRIESNRPGNAGNVESEQAQANNLFTYLAKAFHFVKPGSFRVCLNNVAQSTSKGEYFPAGCVILNPGLLTGCFLAKSMTKEIIRPDECHLNRKCFLDNEKEFRKLIFARQLPMGHSTLWGSKGIKLVPHIIYHID